MNVECQSQEPVEIFDSLYTNEHIQLMKVIYGMVPVSTQRLLAPMIKYRELCYTIELTRKGFPSMCDDAENKEPDIGDLLLRMRPYMNDSEWSQVSRISEMYHMLKTFDQLKDTLADFEQKTGISLSQLMNSQSSPEDMLKMFTAGSDMMSFQNLFNNEKGDEHE